MLDAIAVLRGEGAFVADPYEIPNQAAISAFGICVVVPAARQLLDGADVRPEAGPQQLPGHSPERAGPYAERHHRLQQRARRRRAQVRPGHLPRRRPARHQPRQRGHPRYLADRAQDLALTRTGLDAVFDGPDGIRGTEDDFDAILFPQNRGAGAPAKAGYPSIVVPGGFVPPVDPVVNPAPFGVTFTGRAFSEPTLIASPTRSSRRRSHRQPPGERAAATQRHGRSTVARATAAHHWAKSVLASRLGV